MSDQWTSTTLGTIFPGPSATVSALKTKSQNLLGRYNALLSEVSSKASALGSIQSDTTSLADAMTQSGFYQLKLEPGAGGWLSRAQNAAGAPPDTGASAGILIVIQAPDASSLAAQYAKLSAILATPVGVP